jgi:hypothetical protein
VLILLLNIIFLETRKPMRKGRIFLLCVKRIDTFIASCAVAVTLFTLSIAAMSGQGDKMAVKS